ncbi:MAG: DnaB helicase C-terminal domain-containing protein [Lachnospiraceae bacterium]|nr:DnaB helicase C-terminal domain-containing protein [Lachnospiraceae bacterium]
MDKIFSHFIGRNDDDMQRLAYASWFIESIPIDEFDSDEKLFWKYIEYSCTLNAPLRSKYFDLWLNTELRHVLRETNARVLGCEALNYDEPVAFETAVKTTTRVMQDNFTLLETMPSELDDFRVEAATYFATKRNEKLQSGLSNIYEKLNDTDDAIYATDYALDVINNINEIYSSSKLTDLGESLDSDEMTFISDSGLPAIDKDSDGIFTSQLYGIEAQPGTGKTRFACGTYAYRAAVLYGHDVVFISLEQKKIEIESMWLALHVFNMFNIQLNDKLIRTKKYPKEYEPQVEAARYDLFHSGKYGKLIALEETLYVQNFVTRLRNLDRLKGPFDLIIIDYMGLIQYKKEKYQKDMSLGDRISEVYMQFKGYVRSSNKAGIAIGQFNKEGITAGENDKAITPDMAQGGIAVYRHTDYNIAISRTETMRLQQKVRFSQPKVRASAGFGTFLADTRLGFCYFKQVAAKAV